MNQNETESGIGSRIKHFREKQGMTQKQLGEKCGIDAANIRKYESGKQNPKLDTLKKIAKGLGVHAWDLCERHPLFGDLSDLEPASDASEEEQKEFARLEESYYLTMGYNLSAIGRELNDEFRNQGRIFSRIPEVAAVQAQINELILNYYKLNEEGRKKALERIQELTEIERYRDEETAQKLDEEIAKLNADTAGMEPDNTDTEE